MDNKDLNLFEELFAISNLFEIIGIFNIIYIILINLIPKLYSLNIFKKKKDRKKKQKILLISFITIITCWIPYFLSFFPGTLSLDSLGELNMIINNFSNVTDHHTVLHILFIAIPYKIGFAMFGTITSGIVLSTITQMILLAYIFAYFITFLYERNISKNILIIILLFYAILPMNGYYSIVMWKDVMFAGSLLLLTIETIKIIEKQKENKLNFKNLISFIPISLLCIFFRNNAIYMYAILAIITLIIFKKHFKLFLSIFFIVFSTYIIIKGPILNYLNISKSASAEYIAMPLQQIGRMAYKNVNFTDKERKLINNLLPTEIMASVYNPYVVDAIKFNKNYNISAFDNNKGKYFKLWINLVKENPEIAIEAYSASTLGYWYPGVKYWSVMDYIPENEYGITLKPILPEPLTYTIKALSSKEIPIINMQWSIGLGIWLMLLFSILTIKKNKLPAIYPFIPSIGIWITLMIASPVFGEFRYVYCIFVCLPLLALCPYLKLKTK